MRYASLLVFASDRRTILHSVINIYRAVVWRSKWTCKGGMNRVGVNSSWFDDKDFLFSSSGMIEVIVFNRSKRSFQYYFNLYGDY